MRRPRYKVASKVDVWLPRAAAFEFIEVMAAAVIEMLRTLLKNVKN